MVVKNDIRTLAMCANELGDSPIWHTGAIEGFGPDTGPKLEEVKLPVAGPTSCCFCGEQLDTLYVTSARKGLGKGAIANQPLAGAVFAVSGIGVKGKNTYYYRDKNE